MLTDTSSRIEVEGMTSDPILVSDEPAARDQLHTIAGLVGEAASRSPGATALLSPGRRPGTYADLLKTMEQTAEVLRSMGIGAGDRVAVVLDNGPEAASVFLSIAAVAACAPLNPAYREAEFDFFITDLQPKAIVIGEGSRSPALAVARSRGVPIVTLQVCADQSCGTFTLHPETPAGPPTVEGFAGPADAALLLHTSGTTSRPKLVVLTHENLCHSARNIQRSLELTERDRCLNIMPLFHIHGLAGAVLSSLCAGGSVVCTPGFLAPSFFDWLQEFRPTWYTAVPTMHQAILARSADEFGSADECPLRFIRSCSSALPPQLMSGLEAALGAPVVEAYGMTEAAHQMCCNPLPPRARKPGSVGVATGPQVAIMNDAGDLLPPGERGEVVIQGANVTSGYANNAEANSKAFTNGWFRTGDLGYIDGDGYLFLSGRTKEIINRGGEKISPREIDEALLDHPGVAQALAFAAPDPRLGEDVAAAVVLRPGHKVNERELREFAAQRLSDFKVPRRIVILDEIPKGPTGKPQRIGLAAKLGIVFEQREEFVAARTALETDLCRIWSAVLGKTEIGVRDTFWNLGGESLLAARMLSQVQRATGAEVPIFAFFATPSIEGLAGLVESYIGRAKATLVRHTPSEEAPLSFAQERMWFLAQLEADASPYARVAVYRFRGPLDPAKTRHALERVIERHEILRTTYHDREGSLRQAIHAPGPLAIEFKTVSEVNAVKEIAAAEVQRSFDLSRGPIVRVTLAQLAPDDHCLVLALHHIAFDGWSAGVFLNDFAGFYQDAPPPDLAIQYSDYARWQRGQPYAESLAWWQDRLAGGSGLLKLPTDHPRPARQSYRGGREALTLPAELAGAIERLSRNENVTPFTILLAAFQTLLHRYTASDDIAVGCPIANRTPVETEALIGLFVNTLAMRTDFSGDPVFRDLLERVRETAVSAYAHADAPFEKIVEALAPQRSLGYSPLFQVFFQLRNLPAETRGFGEVAVEPVEFDPGVAPFDLVLDVQPEGGALRCVLDYNADIFERSTARRMLRHYRTLLEAIASDPGARVSRLPIMAEAELSEVLAGASGPRPPGEPSTALVRRFEAQAARMPSRPALIHGEESISYEQLNGRANRLARELQSRGVGPETIAGIQIERGPSYIVAMLAVLKAGGAFLPLDPNYPQARLAFMAADARPVAIVTGDEQGAGRSEENVYVEADPGGLAYTIYTSGSTGEPKGVLGLHQGLTARLEWMWRRYPFEHGEVCCQKTATGFVDSICEILGPLLQGVPLVIFGDEVVKGSPLGFVRALDRERVTRIVAVPAQLANLLDAIESLGATLPALKYCFSSGEALPSELARRFTRLLPHVRLVNLYGSSEVSADATCYEIVSDAIPDPVPIGRPISGASAYVLSPDLQPVPAGVAGELCIGGAIVARGYLNRPELTSERFIADPFGPPGATLFRTGDLARVNTSGEIEFLGRIDDQVKIRGCRVEPGEIEAVLLRHQDVSACAVAARADERGDCRLVAWIVPRDGTAPDLRPELAAWLPEYMVPSEFVTVSALPLQPNGKVDRRALALPEIVPAAGVLPRDRFEQALQTLWEELLHRPVGIHEGFFDIGGHSLLAARMVARIEAQFGATIPLAALFERPSIAKLAPILAQSESLRYPRNILPIQPAGSRPPLFCVGGGPVMLPLAQCLGPDQPLLGLTIDFAEVQEIAGQPSVPPIAARLVESLLDYQPQGPYRLAGYSMHGLYAYEVARQLHNAGHQVALVALFDTHLWSAARARHSVLSRAGAHLGALARRAAELNLRDFTQHVEALFGILKAVSAAQSPTRSPAQQDLLTALAEALRSAAQQFVPEPSPVPITFFEAASQPMGTEAGARFGWSPLATQGLDIRLVPGEHATMLDDPHVARLADELTRALETAAR